MLTIYDYKMAHTKLMPLIDMILLEKQTIHTSENTQSNEIFESTYILFCTSVSQGSNDLDLALSYSHFFPFASPRMA